VARTPEFEGFVHDMAMQVVASRPEYVGVEDIPAQVVEQEKARYRKEMEGQGKPEQVLERIVEGKLRRFYEQVCLLEQSFIKDEDKKVATLLTEMIAKLGENIVIRRFARLQVGE
jgi:elongation factor Ts